MSDIDVKIWHSPAKTAKPKPAMDAERGETYLRDQLAESLCAQASRLLEARQLLEYLKHAEHVSQAGQQAMRVAVRGLTGSAPSWIAAWLQRTTGRTVLVLSASGDVFEETRDDLEYFRGAGNLMAFPEPDTLPYDPASPHPGITAQRLETLSRLARGERGIVLATTRGVLQRLPSPQRLESALVELSVGGDSDPLALAERLVFMGYERLPEVESSGHFARRGGILDIYPAGAADPVRLEFDNTTIVSMRRFDAGTQRSLEPLTSVRIVPRYEVIVSPEEAPAVAERLRLAREAEPRDGEAATTQFLFHDGMERFAGHYDNNAASLTDYLPDDTIVICDQPGALRDRAEELAEMIERGHSEALEHFPGVSPPSALYLPSAALDALCREYPGVDWMDTVQTPGTEDRYGASLFIECAPAEPVQRSIERLKHLLMELGANSIDTTILCDNAGQRDRLFELMGEAGARLGVGLITAGFTVRGAGLAVLTDHEIFSRYKRRRRRLKRTGGLSIAELSALKTGDFVVHEEYGVGSYCGLRRLTLNGQETDCVELSYAGTDRLFVPVQQLALVSRYAAGEGAKPAVHRLGSGQWAKTKARAKKAIQDMAEKLIKAYAARRALPGHACRPDTVWQHEMEASFPYEETPDQMKAIEDAKADMESERPMDRLVCGDVGYGKTEVAIRAAFKAVQDGRQVAVLVPTTILAQQHGLTFGERLADYPIKVAVMSRFRSPKEQKHTLRELADGKVDIVIGTHRLLSKDVIIPRLGLVVIDEEHRFGVAQKEKIRQLVGQADVLAMTATPIPRTLNLSLAGARDMSVIETPPADRLPVHTEIIEFDEEVITDAILREIDRNGQVFYVHNRVETIHNTALMLQKLVPQVRVAVAHGQMAEKPLEQVMLDFIEKKYDVLVSTMIVESGLDIPSVNTLIVDRADTLGLAQLYQLRGRVGRSANRAFAYLLVPSRRVLTEEAQKRLRVIEEFDELGVGFKVALKDMEIRGAGTMLGPEQSGFILGLGFDLYVKLLEEAVSELKGTAEAPATEPRLLTDWSAFLPEDYMPDEHEKLDLYRRLAETRTIDNLDNLTLEMLDRFGQLPAPTIALFELRRLRILGAGVLIESLRVFQQVTEVQLKRPLRPDEIRAIVGATSFQVEFFSGREFGLRVRGEGIILLNRAKELLEMIAATTSLT